MYRRIVSTLFMACLLLLFSCQEEHQQPMGNQTNARKLTPGKLDVRVIKFIKPEKGNNTTARETQACIIDGQLWDECPFNGGDAGTGGGGGSNPQNVLSDFNPLSGSITVSPNPANSGATVNLTFVIANQGGVKFPSGSLQPLDDLGIVGVHLAVHLLSPQFSTPSESNKIFIGVFDPGNSTSPVDFGISTSIQLPSSLNAAVNYQIAIVVDPENLVPELNETNNTSFDTDLLKINGPKPDLVPLNQVGDFKISPEIVAIGESLTVGCKVKLTGANLIGPTSFKIKYTAHAVGGDELANPKVLAVVTHSISSGQLFTNGTSTGILSKTLTVQGIGVGLGALTGFMPGDYIVKATVDSDLQIVETASGELNNTITLGPLKIGAAGSKPDLIDAGVLSPSPFAPDSLKPGESLHFSVQLKNQGGLDAGTFTTRAYITPVDLSIPSADVTVSASDHFIGALQLNGLLAGKTVTHSFSGTVPANTRPGLYYVGWIIDTDGGTNGQVIESNETNNKRVITSRFLKVRGPDLQFKLGPGTASITTFLPNHEVMPGKNVKVEVTLENVSSVPCTQNILNIGLYLSSDIVLDETDYFMGDYNKALSPLPAFSSVRFTMDVKIPDDYPTVALNTPLLLILNVDDPGIPILFQGQLFYTHGQFGEELEEDETNNGMVLGPITVVSACDLIDETTVFDIFTDAVNFLPNGGFCTKVNTFDPYNAWTSQGFIKDYEYFKNKELLYNGKYCSDKFASFYDRWYAKIAPLVTEVRNQCPTEAAFSYTNITSTALGVKFAHLAEQYIDELKSLKQSCNPPPGETEQNPPTRVYCGCPDTNFLSGFPGPTPGTSGCGIP